MQKLNTKRVKLSDNKWANEVEFSKEEIQLANDYFKKCSTSPQASEKCKLKN